jgi:putative AdoMet-dependent methyltransferase
MPTPDWYWDEFQHAGTDYSDAEEVRRYDQRMSQFRDVDAENREAIESLQLQSNDLLLEIGCGTGRLARSASKCCRQVIAYDVSASMIDFACQEATREELSNVKFLRGGFLSRPELEGLVDAVVSRIALHHLPDFWKAVAVARVFEDLKSGGLFHLTDVVFSFPLENHEERLQSWIDGMPPDTSPLAVGHVQGEYSTQAWVMEGILERAGFSVESVEYSDDGMLATFIARKP